MVIKITKRLLSYFLGALGWMLIISLLKLYCLLNVPLLVEGLWTKAINDDLVENISGDIAFDASEDWCDGRYIFTARYYPKGQDDQFENKPLSSMVDIGSWKMIEKKSGKTIFEDEKYRYVLNDVSDGLYMEIFDK